MASPALRFLRQRQEGGKNLAGEAGFLRYPLLMAASERVRRLAEGYAELTDEERQDFETLVAPVEDGDVPADWREEVRYRVADIDSGRVSLIDGEDFLQRLRAV